MIKYCYETATVVNYLTVKRNNSFQSEYCNKRFVNQPRDKTYRRPHKCKIYSGFPFYDSTLYILQNLYEINPKYCDR